MNTFPDGIKQDIVEIASSLPRCETPQVVVPNELSFGSKRLETHFDE